MKIHSKELISELKYFVKKGVSFAAESGKHDDLVMGCVIFFGMLRVMGEYDGDVFDRLNKINLMSEFDDEDDGIAEPMPMIF